MHNAKFDLAFLDKAGLDLSSLEVHDTMVAQRLIHNNLNRYSLDALTGQKDKTVSAYITKNKLWTDYKYPDKKEAVRIRHYDKVPIEIMMPYAEKDARLTYDLGLKQCEVLCGNPVYKTEMKLIKVLFNMRKKGFQIDTVVTNNMYSTCIQKYKELENTWYHLTGVPYQERAKVFKDVFTQFNIPLQLTEKGNPCFKEEVLDGVKHPIAEIIKERRAWYKKAHTYYWNYLYLMDKEGRVHCNLNQSGTNTGRMSSSDPNLQNLARSSDENSPRACFIAEDDYMLVEMDYKAMEFRLLLEMAGEMDVISQVKDGKDLHLATADLLGVSRDAAKTLNYMLLYGGGAETLADKLHISVDEAVTLKNNYFKKFPKIKTFTNAVQNMAKRKGYITNLYGRRYEVTDGFFRAVNYLIQGTGADIVKKAMLAIEHKLKGYKSFMVLQLHDALYFQVHMDELHLIEELKSIMKHTFVPKNLGMDVSVLVGDRWSTLTEQKED